MSAAPGCPACGAELESFSQESYDEELIRALHHPEPTVPTRAAAILGNLGSRAAVVPLMQLAECESDLYIQKAAVVALEHIVDSTAVPLLIRLEREASLRVRIAASRAIKPLGGVPNESQRRNARRAGGGPK